MQLKYLKNIQSPEDIRDYSIDELKELCNEIRDYTIDTVTTVGGHLAPTLGAIELIPKRQFYDYKAKYSATAQTKHIMPANLKKSKYKEVLKIAKKAHHILGCKGITRSDFKFFKNQFYLLEINTQPGMTSLSLVPEIASYKRISFENLVEKILLNASINR